MALFRSITLCVPTVLFIFFFVGLEAVIIECEDENVHKNVTASKTGFAHASFCAEIRPPPEAYAVIPLTETYCFTHHLCAGQYFWWWEATEPEQDIYTIHVQIRDTKEKGGGDFPITVFTNRYSESLELTVTVSEDGDETEKSVEPEHSTPPVLAECADAQAKSPGSGSKKCPSGWLSVGDGYCVMSDLENPLNFPMAKESCEMFGATLVTLGEVKDTKERKKRATDEDEEEDVDYEDDEEDLWDDEDDEEDDFEDEDDEEGKGEEEKPEGESPEGSEEEEDEEDEEGEDPDEQTEGEYEDEEKGEETENEDADVDPEVEEGTDEESDSDKEEDDKDEDDSEEPYDDEGGEDYDYDDEGTDEESDVKDLDEFVKEKDDDGVKGTNVGEKFTKVERVSDDMEETKQYSINTCLNARLAVQAGSQNLWVLDDQDPSSCLSYNSVTKTVQEEATCHFLYNKFSCMFDTRKYEKPTVTKFHVHFKYSKGHHQNHDLSVTKPGVTYHEVKNGVTSATITCEADGWPKPEVVIVEDAPTPQARSLHTSPHQHNISDSDGVFLGKFACVATNIFGDEVKIGDLQLWRYEAPRRLSLITSGVLVLVIVVLVVAILVILNRYRIFTRFGACHSYIVSCRCFTCPRRRPKGSARVPTDIFPASQDYVYGDVWADEVPLYVRQARGNKPAEPGTIYRKVKEQDPEQGQEQE